MYQQQNQFATQYQGGPQYKNPPGVPANYVPPPSLAPYQGQPMVVQGQPQTQVIVVQQPPLNMFREPVYEGLPVGKLRVAGILQIVDGSIAFLINIMARVVLASYTVIGIGFWGGIFFIISGSMGILASARMTQPTVRAGAALAIVAGVLALIMIALSAAGISSDVAYGPQYYYYYYLYSDPQGWYNAAIAANSLLLMLGVVEVSMAIWQAAITFTALCTMQPVTPPPVTQPAVQVVPPQQQQQQQQFVMVTGGPSTSTYPPTYAAAAAPPPYNPYYENKVTDQ